MEIFWKIWMPKMKAKVWFEKIHPTLKQDFRTGFFYSIVGNYMAVGGYMTVDEYLHLSLFTRTFGAPLSSKIKEDSLSRIIPFSGNISAQVAKGGRVNE